MRRFITVAALSLALAAGHAAVVSPAAAASPGADGFGVEDTVIRQGTISGAEVLAQARRDGTRYTAAEAEAIRKAPCRWYERQQGRRASKKGRWLIWVKVRLNWCYDGYQVVSAKAKYRSYTYDRATWRWRGWAKKRLTHTGSWSSVTTRTQGKFYYTGNGRTYKPWATIQGNFDGGYRWWAGG
ncbi:hypothetical protein LO762_26650 [Actinocorallia sp. API 0066]|uniref:hypothetical protein n=1 Tax=Actinocorallia sp. API 0066 TaxID=2896846 RepID=UPI001E5922AB|nr:hypothetical protein [Actinocorallia sp. API 0066]MCD0452735.1 hypothetical protein [Actinocorallia sp. API 0066]